MPATHPLPSDCMASSLCWTCWAIALLMAMRFSVMVPDVCARLSLVVFLKVQSGRRHVNESWLQGSPRGQTRPHFSNLSNWEGSFKGSWSVWQGRAGPHSEACQRGHRPARPSGTQTVPPP